MALKEKLHNEGVEKVLRATARTVFQMAQLQRLHFPKDVARSAELEKLSNTIAETAMLFDQP